MQAVRIHQFGGPEQMVLEELPTPDPGPGEARVRVAAAGVNYSEVGQRTGSAGGPLPQTIGREGAGTVEALAAGVDQVAVGDRVVWCGIPGAYATHAVVPAERLVRIPDRLSFEQAAAAMLQGMTAHYLAYSTHPLQPGESCLVHAAAGGVGLLLCQLAKRRGARVIGTVSTEAKAALAREAGADEVILYSTRDFEAEVKRLTDGRGVNVVYDAVGKDTYQKSFNCLARRGMLVLYGQASGPVPPIETRVLNTLGSLYLTRPSLFDYVATRQELLDRSGEVFGMVLDGSLKLRIERSYPLAEAAQAHRDLTGRRTTGKLLILP
jgi:NADPH2:quinone reductase